MSSRLALLCSLLMLPAACSPEEDASGDVIMLGQDSGIIIIGADAAVPGDGGAPDSAPDDRPPAEPDERVGLGCEEPGAFGPPCVGLCATTPDGPICTVPCEGNPDCPGGYECRGVYRGEAFCMPIDPRCPPDGPVLGRDPDCGCLDGEHVGAGEGEACTRSCADEPCDAGFVCDAAEQICLEAAPIDGEFVDREPADGATVRGGTFLRWVFDSETNIGTFDVYLGPAGAEPPLYDSGRPASGGDSSSMPIPAEVIDAGGTWNWKVVARSGGRQAESAVWTFEVGASRPRPGPCPDTPTVRLGRRTYDTVLIGTNCWMEQGPVVGEPAGGPDGLTSFDDGTVQHARHVGDGYFYSWWEAHNSYGVDGEDVTLVGSSICPDGWRLPTQAEWSQAVSAGNRINPDRESSAIDLSLATGLYNLRDTALDRCDVGGERQRCSTFDGHAGSGTYYFWAADEGDPAEAASVRISRPTGGATDYGFGRGRTAPTFGLQVRCIQED